MKRSTRVKLFLLLSVIVIMLAGSAPAAQFSGGSGSANDPFIITTAAQLDAVRENRTSHFRLGNDIDLTAYLAPGGEGYAKWGPAGWLPIGTDAVNGEFRGGFNGGRHVITGLRINRASTNNVGLFGYARAATFEYLGVKIASGGIRGGENVGGLLGGSRDSFATAIRNCYVAGVVNGAERVGGLVGRFGNGCIRNCYVTADVNGGNHVGGLVGSSSDRIENSYATGNISGSQSIGGLVGEWTGRVINCYSTGNVSGNNASNVWALAGTGSGTITGSYRYQLAMVNGEVRSEHTPNGRQGGIVSASQLTTQATYFSTHSSWVFNNAEWHWDSRGFPKLNIGTENPTFSFLPSEPVEPSEPVYPSDPMESSGPVYPSDPVGPSEPIEPGEDIELSSVSIRTEEVRRDAIRFSHVKTPSNANGSFIYSWSSNHPNIVHVSGMSDGEGATVAPGNTTGTARITLTVTQTMPSGSSVVVTDSIDVQVTSPFNFANDPIKIPDTVNINVGGCNAAPGALIALSLLSLFFVGRRRR